MALKWSQVTSKPEFQALSPAEREAARQQYFDAVIRPQVPSDDQDTAKDQFNAQTYKAAGGGRGIAAGMTAAEAPGAAPPPTESPNTRAAAAPRTPTARSIAAESPDAPAVDQMGNQLGADAPVVDDRSVLERVPPRQPNGAELSGIAPQFVEQLRQDFGKMPPEQRLGKLRAMAVRDDVYGKAAKVILDGAEATNAQLTRESERKATDVLAATTGTGAPGKPKKPGISGEPAPDITFPDTTPHLLDLADGNTDPAAIAARRDMATRLQQSQAGAEALGERAKITAQAKTQERIAAAQKAIAEGRASSGLGGDTLKDIAAIAPATAKMVGDVVSMGTGGKLNGISGWAQAQIEDLEAQKSPGFRKLQEQLAAIQADPNATPLTILGFLVAHPSVPLSSAIQSSGSMAVTGGIGGVLGKGGAALAARGLTGARTAAIEGELAALRSRIATSGAIGGEALTGAAGVFNDLDGQSVADRYNGAALAALGYVGVGKLTRGGAAGAVARGSEAKGVRAAAGEFARETAEGAGEEFGQTFSEEAGKALGKNQPLDVNDATKQSVTAAASGAIMGGGASASNIAAHNFASVFDVASSKGFHVEPPLTTDDPVTLVKRRVSAFQNVAALYGIPDAAVKRAVQEAKNMPAEQVGPFLKSLVGALGKRGLVKGEVDPDVTATLDAPPIDPAIAETKPTAGETTKPNSGTASPNSVTPDAEEDLTGLADASPIDVAAHAAAPSPKNELPEPTEAQKAAGNYPKGHLKFAGLDISIENPEGSTRAGTDPDGKAWENKLAHHYGYIRRTESADGEQVNAFIKPGTRDDHDGPAFIVDQIDPKTGKYDEAKVMLGFASEQEAREAYAANYAPGWKGLGAISEVDQPALKEWLRSDAASKPFAPVTAKGASDATAPVGDLGGARRDADNGRSAEPVPLLQAGPAGGQEPSPAGDAVGRGAEVVPARSEPAEPTRALTGPRTIGKAGTTPATAEAIELRANPDGTLTPYQGKYPLTDYESGEPVSIPADASDDDAFAAIKAAGSFGRNTKVFRDKPAASEDAPPTYKGQPVASWVIRERESKKPVKETFDRAEADKVADSKKYEAVPVQQHLGELNKAIKAGKTPAWASGGDPIAKPAPVEAPPAAAPTVAAAQAPAEPAPTPGKAPAKSSRAPMTKEQRIAAQQAGSSERNPFKAFLGRHGLSMDLAKEFAPGQAERRAAMVPGYGPIFRKNGLQIDELAQRAAEDGFLPPGSEDTDTLYEMIGDAMRGERIPATYSAAGQAEMQRNAERELADAELAAIELEAVTDDQLQDIDDLWNDQAPPQSTADAMKALGFTEQEIADAIAAEGSKGASNSEGDRGAAAPAQGRSEAGDPRGDEGPGDAAEERLTAEQANDRASQLIGEYRADFGTTPSGMTTEEFYAFGDRRRAAAAKIDAEILALAQASPEGLLLPSKSGNSMFMLHPDPRAEGAWRTTTFLPDMTPSGHMEFNKPIEAATEFRNFAAGTEPGLTRPTIEDIKAADKRLMDAAKAERDEQKRLADKAQADAERNEFTLTGSDRPADVAAAAGQQDIFGAPEPEAATALPPAPPTRANSAAQANAFANDFAALEGRTLVQQIQLTTGESATLKLDAAQAMRALAARERVLRELRTCIGSRG